MVITFLASVTCGFSSTLSRLFDFWHWQTNAVFLSVFAAFHSYSRFVSAHICLGLCRDLCCSSSPVTINKLIRISARCVHGFNRVVWRSEKRRRWKKISRHFFIEVYCCKPLSPGEGTLSDLPCSLLENISNRQFEQHHIHVPVHRLNSRGNNVPKNPLTLRKLRVLQPR